MLAVCMCECLSSRQQIPNTRMQHVWLLWQIACQSHKNLADAGMVGDVNLYLNDADDLQTGEIEVIPWQFICQLLVTVP